HSKVLVLAGADDPYQKQTDLDAFNREMALGKVDYRYIAYPGAVHAFTEPEAGNDNSKGAAYNAEADRKSWDEMKGFLKGLFK
ncbi:dienelactone hydrolase family protein, partial [Acinetobacter baumannii]